MALSDEARTFLDRHRLAHLATADASGVPHVVPLCFARLAERLYFVADDKPKRRGPGALRRLANIAANPRVALVVDDYDEDWTRLAYLLLHLDASPVEDEVEYAAALAALRTRYAGYRTMPLARATHPMVRLVLRRWHFWRASGTSAVK
jgi:PPOX class probable F420-dependent enzyme